MRVLRDEFPGFVDGLRTIPETNRVMGFIASDAFVGLDHEERQDKLWKLIEQHFSAEDIRNIGPIVTMTRDEATLHSASADD